MKLYGKRKVQEAAEKLDKNVIRMVTTYGESFYSWNGKLYESDIVRSCLRPKVKAVGKLLGKNVRMDVSGLVIKPDARIRFLQSEPNPQITGQHFQKTAGRCSYIRYHVFYVRQNTWKASCI